MSDEFTIQCPKCGTLYNDLQDVCPYCGEPQPTEEAAFVPNDYFVEPEPPDAFAGGPGHDDYDDDTADPFIDDDIFAVDGGPYGQPADYPDEPAADYFGAIGRPDAFAPADDLTADTGFIGPDTPYPADDTGEDEELLPEEEPAELTAAAPRRFKFRRVALGCLGLLLCAGLFYGAIGIFAVRAGLQERATQAQSESQTHYERGQQLLAENSIELAVAEFERAVKLNPSFREARQALREAQRLAQLQPTPTSETRTAAAAEIFAQAQELFNAENWADAAQMLSQVRDLDSNYEAEQVSEMLFEANFQLGLQQVSPEQVREALAAFEQALVEHPDDERVRAERNKAALYLNGLEALDTDKLNALKAFTQLFRLDENYLDTRQKLRQAYETYGDQLANDGEWCLAKDQYTEANALRASTSVLGKLNISAERCQAEAVTQAPGGAAPRPGVTAAPGSSATAGPAGITASATITATTEAAADSAPISSAGGRILFSAYNDSETRWEILATPATGGPLQTLATDGIMPALSPNGDILLYRSERPDSIGIHALNLTTGEDVRATVVRQHILPRWAGDNLQFVFPAQEPGTNRWQVFVGFADGKSDPIILLDGRTPDSDGKTIVYQGTDPEGNQPGIYSRAFGGGEATRLTSHESDRMPVLSPDGSRVAYMSTQNGNWDIFVVSAAGGSPKAVVNSPGNDGLPAWSPDGSQLAFVSDRGGSWAIYVVNLAGGAPSKLTDWDGNRPDWLTAQIWWGR